MVFKRQSEHLKSEVVAGTEMSRWEAQVLLDVVERIYWNDPELKPCKEHQLRLTCVAVHECPGKPLALCAKRSVVITLFDDEDEEQWHDFSIQQRMARTRQRHICRIVDEA